MAEAGTGDPKRKHYQHDDAYACATRIDVNIEYQ